MTLPLTKSLDLADLQSLVFEQGLIATGGGIGEQHPLRLWEYAMALHAIGEHRRPASHEGLDWLAQPYRVLDVGGAGSAFSQILTAAWPTVVCEVVDPKVNSGIEEAPIPAASQDAVISISTIEHVPEPAPFLAACARVLVHGGLLFLTMDGWGKVGPDTAHYHWMRERIYSPVAWRQLAGQIKDLGFSLLGESDWVYHGDQLFGSYTFFSLALVKESR